MKPDREKQFLQLESFLRKDRDAMVDVLTRLLTFVTVSGSTDIEEQHHHRNELARGFSFLNDLARRMGLAYRNYENRLCVIEATGGPEVLGVPLHLDVVPSGEGWNYPAFGGVVEDSVIYGRGAQDNKGPIAAALYALGAIRRLGVPLRRTVRLIVASQEETGDWSDIEAYLRKEPPPDFSIVPDSNFPIISGEKGWADVRIALRWKPANSARAALHFQRLQSGERSNVVPNRADLVWAASEGQAKEVAKTVAQCLESYLKTRPKADAFPLRIDKELNGAGRQIHATFLGKSAHGSRPRAGHNAALDGLDFLSVVPDLDPGARRAAEFLADVCGAPYGERLGLARQHKFVGRTTISLGRLDLTARSAEAILNIRPTYGATCDETLASVRNVVAQWAKSHGVEAKIDFVKKPYEPLFVDPKRHAKMLRALQIAFERVTGEKATLGAKGGTTFAKAFPNAVGFGPVFLKEEKDLAHQANECVKVEHLERNARIYALALLLLAT